jgi:HEAT repeat protein
LSSDPRESGPELGVFTLDDRLIVRTWDAWLALVTGIAAETARGSALDALLPDLDARGLRARFLEVLRSGEPQVLSSAFHRHLFPCPPSKPIAGFERMHQRVMLGPLRDGARIVGIVGTVEDVTAQVARERALGEALRSTDPRVRDEAARQVAAAETIAAPQAFTPARADDDWRVRRAATQGLAPHAHRSMLAALLKGLKEGHRDFNVLSSALTLVTNADVDLTGPLIELLKDPDPDLRMQAALALGDHHRPGGNEALVDALGDPDVNVRFHAIEALGRLRASEAVDALSGIAESGDFFLAFPAIDALARLNDPRVIDHLVGLLRVPLLRDAVVDALGHLGGSECLPALVAALDQDAAAGIVATALVRIHDRYQSRYGAGAFIAGEVRRMMHAAAERRLLDALAAGDREHTGAMVTVASWLGSSAVQRALADLLARPGGAPSIIEAIVRQGSSIVNLLIEQLDDPEEDAQRGAIIALGRIGDRRATAALIRLLNGERGTVLAAAGALAQLGDPAAYEPLLPLLAHDDVSIRQAAIGALNSIGHPAMGSQALMLLRDQSAVVREAAVRIAGYFGYSECRDAFMACCSDPVERVRRAALENLPYLDDPRATEVLAAALAHDTPGARAAAAQALGHQDDAAAVEALTGALRDPDAWVRYYAVRSLAQREATMAASAVARLAQEDSVGHVRIAALEALGAIGGDSVIEFMLVLIEGGQDEVAAAALRGLPRAADPRVEGAVRDSVRSSSPLRRLAAVQALANMSAPDTVELLEYLAGGDTDLDVAGAALDVLASAARVDSPRGDRAVAALVRLASDPGAGERFGQRLAKLPERRVDALASLLDDPSPAVRLAAIDALGRLPHASASAAIKSALHDTRDEVRAAAISALDRIGATGLQGVFGELAQHDPSAAVRRTATAALRRTAAHRGHE